MQINDPMKAFQDAGRDGVYQFTRLVWEGPGRLMGRNIDTMQEFVRLSGNRLGEAWSDISHMSPVTDWPAMMNTCLQCGVAINQLAIRAASQAFTDATGQSMSGFPFKFPDRDTNRPSSA